MIKLRDVVQRCTRVTNQIATFSRAETIRPSIVDLNVAIACKKPELSELLGSTVELELRLDASDGVVRMSACDVEQILLSTLRNARQAMPRGGSLAIETRMREEVDARTESRRWLRLSISDTGEGMPEHVRRHALEAFFTTKPPGAGTGLGLSIVAAIVRRAGGTITIESAPGKGTTLLIDLPCGSGAQ
jgi:signal transduction histidine kinase